MAYGRTDSGPVPPNQSHQPACRPRQDPCSQPGSLDGLAAQVGVGLLARFVAVARGVEADLVYRRHNTLDDALVVFVLLVGVAVELGVASATQYDPQI